jgi:hypothetical protein
MTWAQRLKRVVKIDIETCEQCDGVVKVIASIEDPVVIKQILDHLENFKETVSSGPRNARIPRTGSTLTTTQPQASDVE